MRSLSTFAEGLDHPEGLAFDADGNLWCGGESGQVYRISPDGTIIEIVAQVGGFCLGLAFSPGGDLFICNHKLSAIIRLNPQTLKHRIWARKAGGLPIRVPNSLVFDRQGNLYVSDSGDWGKATGAIYRFDSHGRGVVWQRGLHYANGLALDAEETSLYVVQSTKDNVLSLPILPDGSAGRPKIHAANLTYVPDGLTFDASGNLYVCCYGNSRIYRVTPAGERQIVAEDTQGVRLNRPTNLAFQRPRFNRLMVANLGGCHITAINLP
ncbi:SMP-30/gluconolactonase/LRE family protein [soil metagenome]